MTVVDLNRSVHGLKKYRQYLICTLLLAGGGYYFNHWKRAWKKEKISYYHCITWKICLLPNVFEQLKVMDVFDNDLIFDANQLDSLLLIQSFSSFTQSHWQSGSTQKIFSVTNQKYSSQGQDPPLVTRWSNLHLFLMLPCLSECVHY